MELMLPVVRADLKLVETYAYQPLGSLLTMPITAFTGIDDVDIPLVDVIEWQKLTQNKFSYYELSGDHFFVHQMGYEICGVINQQLC
ncbi:thioesterase II family protein [Spartinivicinus ruber]|uniref:thioesterase II family protein n=1 Tax=Spartinivicinus ruber TaxID=2683272 RepID=UPI0022A6A5DB|nr:hypothetical protein [Spartinivicinus ruber]